MNKTLRTSTEHYYCVCPLARLGHASLQWHCWTVAWVVGHLFVHFTPEHWTLEHSVGMELVRGHNTLVHFIHVHWPVGSLLTQHVASSPIAHDTINTRTRSE